MAEGGKICLKDIVNYLCANFMPFSKGFIFQNPSTIAGINSCLWYVLALNCSLYILSSLDKPLPSVDHAIGSRKMLYSNTLLTLLFKWKKKKKTACSCKRKCFLHLGYDCFEIIILFP